MTYYDLLQVNSNASIEIIKASYKTMAKKYHPDICGDNGEMMSKINEAYEVLSNPDRRKQYDETIRKTESVKPPPNAHELNKTEKNNNDNFDNQNMIIKIIISIIYLIGSGIAYILEFSWGIFLILIIIGLFTGHTQNLFGKLFSFIMGFVR